MPAADDDPARQPEQEYVEEQDREWADGDAPNTFPSGETLKADRRDARAAHDADRPPRGDEGAEAAEATDGRVDPDVAAAYEEAMQRGVDQKGEGRI